MADSSSHIPTEANASGSVPWHRPRHIMDMPNEIIARICYFLTPDEFEARPLKRDEAMASRNTAIQAFKKNGRFGSEIGEHTISTIAAEASRPANSSLAAFAAASMHFNYQAKLQRYQRRFMLTVNEHGMTFEGLRDPRPLKLHTFHLREGGVESFTYRMVDPSSNKLVELPKGKLPGNRAFDVFEGAFNHIVRLCIHVDLEIDWHHLYLPRILLNQLSQFLEARQADRTLLSRLDVTVKAGFHSFETEIRKTSSEFSEIPSRVTYMMFQPPFRSKTIAQLCGKEASSVIEPFVKALQRFRTKQNELRRDPGTLESATVTPLTLQLRMESSGTVNALWNQVLVGTYNGAPESLSVGSFEEFCNSLLSRVIPTGSSGLPAFSVIMKDSLVCEVDIPTNMEWDEA
jgi:hypothetical protein